MRRRHCLATTAALAVGLVVPACGDAPASGRASTVDRSQDQPAVAFTVGWVPAGFDGPQLDIGSGRAELSDDSGDGVQPYVVLVPDGWDGDVDRLAYVTVVDGGSDEGRIPQNLPDYASDPKPQDVGGRDTWRYPDGVATQRPSRGAAPQVVARVRGDLAVRAHSRQAPTALLDRLAATATIASDGRTPDLGVVPAGWHVAGRLDPQQTAVLRDLDVASQEGSGMFPVRASGARRAAWTRGTTWLRVVSVGGSAADLPAAAVVHLSSGWDDRSARWRIVQHGDRWRAERAGAATPVESTPYSAAGAAREITMVGPGGGLLLVTVTGDDLAELPTFKQLDRVASSVRADPEGWDAAVRAEATRPPIAPPGAAVVARGEVDGIEWLLAGVTTGGNGIAGVGQTESQLRLTGGRALTSQGGGGGPGLSIEQLSTVDRPPGARPPFTATLVSVGPAAAAVSLDGGSTRVPTLPAPGGRVAVIIPQAAGIGPVLRYDPTGKQLP